MLFGDGRKPVKILNSISVMLMQVL